MSGRSEDEAKEGMRRASHADGPGPQPLVLVVEDNAVNQQVAVKMLAKLGYRSEVVGNGREAVDAVIGLRYDAVLLDCQMPVLDGYAAATEIRSREPAGRRTPLIAMTAAVMIGERQRCVEAGMDDYVSKPVQFEELAAALSRWVDDPSKEVDDVSMSPVPDVGDVLDRARLADLLELAVGPEGWGALRELASTFATSAAARADELRSAVAAADLDRIANAAHNLRGSAGNLGAATVADLSWQFEAAAQARDFGAAAALLDPLDDAVAAASAALVAAFDDPAA